MEISNGILTAAINPLGAEVISLKHKNREYIWGGDAKYWAKRSPVLFPIVGCLKNSTYIHEGETYALNRHGFARDNIFSLENQTQENISFILKANDDTRVMYPFDFELQIKYSLIDNILQVDFKVKNAGDRNLPFSIGGHPAFALPNDFGSYGLQFANDEELISTRLEEGLLTYNKQKHTVINGKLPLDYSLFENDALVFTELQSGMVELLEDNKPLLKVLFEKMPHMGIWTKKDAPFICIEPWHGYADKADTTGNIFDKEGIITLKPGKTFSTGYAIQIYT